MLETHPFAHGDIGLRLHPFLIHETAKNQTALARRTLDFDGVKQGGCRSGQDANRDYTCASPALNPALGILGKPSTPSEVRSFRTLRWISSARARRGSRQRRK